MEIQHNPFAVKTPESLSAQELVDLFVPYPEFEILMEGGHQFLHGHRGSGKSMMLRMLEPECQVLLRRDKGKVFPFFGVYLSIKATEINQPEFERLENEPSGFILSEHVLVTKILSRVVASVAKNFLLTGNGISSALRFANEDFLHRLMLCGWDEELAAFDALNVDEIFSSLIRIVDRIQAKTIRYVKGRAFTKDPVPYDGALLGFQDMLLPVVQGLREKGLIPDCPVFILLDDADNLTEQQTKILNTWVSYRSTDYLSLKISTQLGYKTFLTSSGVSIEAPHDFAEINFTTARTGSNRGGYTRLVEDIVSKRLMKYGLNEVSVREFFPEDIAQSKAIAAIENELKEKWKTNERGGFRAADDAYRLARPEYIRRISGKSKQFSNYKYAGFEQLVHISSGIIRFFLDPAAKMFADELKKQKKKVEFISPDVQDSQIRKQSDALLMESFESLIKESHKSGPNSTQQIENLKNLITGIGFLFQEFVMDEGASQRRVFSFFVSDNVSKIVFETLDLGVKLGYLYKDAIGRKEGRGRTTLYILTRRLAPAFKLDPIGFSGYVSVTDEYLRTIIKNPNLYKERLRTKVEVEQLNFGF